MRETALTRSLAPGCVIGGPISHNSIQLLIISTDLPFIACVINSPCTFTYYLDLANFILESGLS